MGVKVIFMCKYNCKYECKIKLYLCIFIVGKELNLDFVGYRLK